MIYIDILFLLIVYNILCTTSVIQMYIYKFYSSFI